MICTNKSYTNIIERFCHYLLEGLDLVYRNR